MEPRPLTTWEQKERDGLLALETEEWRQKRLIAEDLNTMADVLESLLGEIRAKSECISEDKEVYLLADALLAHPNISSQNLRFLISNFSTQSTRAFCQNPIVPFVVLEMPNFYERLSPITGRELLIDEMLPKCAASALIRHSEPLISDAARFHISVSGELPTATAGMDALNKFWQDFCTEPYSRAEKVGELGERFWHSQLCVLQFVPKWAKTKYDTDVPSHELKINNLCCRLHPRLFPPRLPIYSLAWSVLKSLARLRKPNLLSYAQYTFILALQKNSFTASYFVRFAASLKEKHSLGRLQASGQSFEWVERLNAALALPMSQTPFPDDSWNRSPRELLQHLAHDGNRFVRWAAQTRLADPNFVFEWHEDET